MRRKHEQHLFLKNAAGFRFSRFIVLLLSRLFLPRHFLFFPHLIALCLNFPRNRFEQFFLSFSAFRDPYVYSLFEITLSAIDSKLRRVDNLERSMEMMLAKMNENSARSDAILAQLKVMDGRMNRMAGGGGGTGGTTGSSSSSAAAADQYSLEPRILALDEKVSQIGTKLNVLTYQLDSNSLLWAGLAGNNETGRPVDDYVSSSSEQARSYVAVPKSDRTGGSDWSRTNNNNGGEDSESIRTTMASMDRHLKILIELFSEQMDKMMSAVADVRTTVIAAQETSMATSEAPLLIATGRSSTINSGVSNAKLDQLYQKMAPLLDVSEKMDQVWNVLIGAKSSVDSLVPTSEALLWQTQRQEQALTDIHAELNVKTKQIIDNLNHVERQLQLRDQISSSSSSSITSSSSTSNLTKRSKSDAHEIIANKPQESQQVSITFKQTAEVPTSRIVTAAIRAQELSPGPVVAAVLAAAKSSTTSTTSTTTSLPLLPPPPEVVPIPSDIMDSEFLHDDPLVAANQTVTTVATNTTKKTSAASAAATAAAAAAAAAAATAANTSSTTSRSVLLQHISPAGPTERSRIPTNSAVIFPSVKNKPGFTNTTFFYDYTTPQNIRVRRRPSDINPLLSSQGWRHPCLDESMI